MARAAEKCRRCGGTRIAPGKLQGRGGSVFLPDDAPFWTLSPHVAITARLCMGCGAVELFGDLEKAERLLPENEGTDQGD